MSSHSYKTIVAKARTMKKSVENEYKFGVNQRWAYFFAQCILYPKHDVQKVKGLSTDKGNAPNPHGDYVSNQIYKKDYIICAERLVSFVKRHGRMPNFVTWVSKKKKIRTRDYCYMFAKILVYYADNNALPAYNNINTKCWTKPTEYPETIYNYFVKKFGKFNNTIDGALILIAGHGYGDYSDDVYSNLTSIDRMANHQGINCTDSCHVFYNILKYLIKFGKYKKVECLHVRCSSGTGHVRLRITLNDGSKILRDPAAVLSSGDVTYNWCTSGFELWAIDPSWFMGNLNR